MIPDCVPTSSPETTFYVRDENNVTRAYREGYPGTLAIIVSGEFIPLPIWGRALHGPEDWLLGVTETATSGFAGVKPIPPGKYIVTWVHTQYYEVQAALQIGNCG